MPNKSSALAQSDSDETPDSTHTTEDLSSTNSNDNPGTQAAAHTIRRIIIISLRSTLLLSAAETLTAVGDAGNNMMRSQLGINEAAASGLIQSIYSPLSLLNFAPLYAVPLVMQEPRIGSRQRELGNIFRQSILMSATIHAIALPFFIAAKPLLESLGQPKEVTSLTQDYFNAYLTGYPAQILGIAKYMFFVGLDNHPTLTFLASIELAAVLGTAYPLIYGIDETDGLAMQGSGYATAIGWYARILIGFFMLAALKKYHQYKLFDINHLFTNFSSWQKKLWVEGGPILLAASTEVVTTFTEGIFAGLLGTSALAATNVSIQYNAINDVINAGLFATITNEVRAREIEKQPAAARRYGNIGIGIGVLFSIALALFALTLTEQIVLLFISPSSNDTSSSTSNVEKAINESVTMLRWTAGMSVLETIKKTTMFSLYGLEDLVFPTAVNMASSWLIGIPLMYIFSNTLEMGPTGLILGLMIAYSAASVILLTRWHIKSQHSSTDTDIDTERTGIEDHSTSGSRSSYA